MIREFAIHYLNVSCRTLCLQRRSTKSDTSLLIPYQERIKEQQEKFTNYEQLQV